MSIDVSTLAIRVTSDGIKEGSSQLSGLSTSANNAEKRVTALMVAMGKLDAVTKTSTAAVDGYLGRLRQQAVVMQELRGSSSATAASTQSLVVAMAGLTAALTAVQARTVQASTSQNVHNNSMREAHALARGLSGSMGALWLTYGNFAGMAIGLAMGASFKVAVSSGMELENILTGIRVKGEETIENINLMRTSIMEMSKGIYAPLEVARAFETLVLAGLNAKGAMDSAKDSLNLATVGGTSIEKAAFTLVQVGTALGYTAKGFSVVGDVIAKTAAVSMSSVESLSEAFKSASAVGKLYGVTLQDLGASLGVLSQLGIQGSAAGTSLKNFYKELSSTSDKVKNTLASMKLTPASFKDDAGNFKSMLEVITLLDSGLKNLSAREQPLAIANLTNERGIKTAVELVYQLRKETTDGGNELKEFYRKVADSAGFAAIGAAQMALTTQAQMKSVLNTLKVSMVEAFKEAEPQVALMARNLRALFDSKEFKEGLNTLITGMTSLASAVANNIPLIASLGAGFIALKAAMITSAAVSGIATALDTLRNSFVGFRVAMTAGTVTSLSFAAALGPLGIALGVAAAAFLLYSMYKTKATDTTALEAANAYSKDYISNLEKETERIRAMNKEMRTGIDVKEATINVNNRLALSEQESRGKEAISKQSDIYEAAMKDKSAKVRSAIESAAGQGKSSLGWAEARTLGSSYNFSEEIAAYKSVIQARNDNTANLEKASKAIEQNKLESVEASKLQAKAIKDNFDRNKELAGTGTIDGGKVQGAESSLKMILSEIEAGKEWLSISAAKLALSKKIADEGVKQEGTQFRVAAAEYLASTATKEALSKINPMERERLIAKIEQLGIEKDIAAFATKQQADEVAAHARLMKDIEQQGTAEVNRLERTLEATKRQNQEIGMTAAQKEEIRAADEAATIAQLESAKLHEEMLLASLSMGVQEEAASLKRLEYLTQELGISQQIKALHEDSASKQLAQQELEDQKKLSNLTIKYWQEAGKEISGALEKAFGKSGKAAGDMFAAFSNYAVKQEKISKTLAENVKLAHGDADKVKEAQQQASLDRAIAETNQYGAMADAAKGFFDEGSRGYEAMNAAAKVMHATELALSLIKGVNAILTQGEGDPYSAFARMAAMAAIVVGLGVAIAGGGSMSGPSSVDIQATQGTGTVLGDSTAKSKSLSNALEDLRDNSDLTLPISQSMLTHLMSIDAAMTGLAQIIFRTTGITSGNSMGIFEGDVLSGASKSIKSIVDSAQKIIGKGDLLSGITSPLLNIASGLLQSLFGKTTSTIKDSGLSIGGTLGSVSRGGGISQYADIESTKKSFFGLVKSTSSSRQMAAVEAQIADQIGKVFKGIGDTMLIVAQTFMTNTSGIAEQIANFAVNLPTISLRGLTGQALQDQLNAVFSSFSDSLALSVLPGMQDFQLVGEGYFQTLVRIVGGIESAKAALDRFGITAISFSDIINKQGDVAVEITRQSIMATELISAAVYSQITETKQISQQVAFSETVMTDIAGANEGLSILIPTVINGFTTVTSTVTEVINKMVSAASYTGIGKILQAFDGTVSELAQLYTELMDIRKLMSNTNLNGGTLSAYTIQGAGGLSELKSGLSSYLENFFSPAEKTAAQVRNLTTQFNLLGYQLPTTKEGFRALVTAIDSTTDAGSKLLGGVLALADPFSEMLDSFDSVNGELQVTIDGFNSFAETLLKFRDSLLLGNLSVLTPEQKYAEATSQYQAMLAAANNGDSAAQQGLTGAMTAFLEASKVVNASGAQYQADFASVLMDTASTAAYAQSQVDIAQASLDALNAINFSVNGVTFAISNLGGVLGFTDTYMQVDGTHASGLTSVPFDGYIAETHAGEGILDAGAMSALKRYFGGTGGLGSSADLVAAVDSLKAEVAALRADQQGQTEATINSNVQVTLAAADRVSSSNMEAAREMAWVGESTKGTSYDR